MFPPFLFNDTASTEIYTLSLHDALPIFDKKQLPPCTKGPRIRRRRQSCLHGDRKSTRLNSSHQIISYAVFCLKKKIPQHQRGRVAAPTAVKGCRMPGGREGRRCEMVGLS